MLNRLFIPLLIVLALTGQANAQKMPYGQGVLWQVHMPTSGAISFLFGTMHSTDPRITTLPTAVEQAFARARSLTIEVIVTKDMPMRMMRRMVLPPKQTLDLIVGAPLFKRLAVVGKNMGFNPDTFERLKPWAAAAAISIPAEERAGQAAGRLPLDQALQKAATRRGIKLFGLETVEEQLSLMDGLPVDDQVKLLSRAIEDAGQVAKLVETMKQFYLARDISGLFSWMRRQAAGQDPRLMQIFQDRMINARNRLMATRMAAQLKTGSAFVAVGAAHLPGRKGVLSLLARQGYRLTKLY